jgi:PAS domain S-box-containing protein
VTLAGIGSLGDPIGGRWQTVLDVLEILDEAVTIRDRDGSIAYGNRAALESMGLASIDELRSRSSRAIMEDYIVEDEGGGPLTLEDVPSIRMMQGQAVKPLVMRTTHRETGEVRWRQLKAAPLTDDQGELIAAVTVIEDVTSVKTAETRMRLLAESGRILASSLDYQQTLRNVANVAVPVLADWCAVDLVDPNLRREHVVVAHSDPEKVALAIRLREMAPDEFETESATGRVLQTGVSELYPDVTEEQLAASAQSEEHLRLLRTLQIRSVLIVPMRVPNRMVGVMTLVTAESRRRLTDDDVELAEQLGRRAAVAVENARLHTTLSEISDTLQRSLMPGALPEVPGWELASLYRPAGGEERIDVGGDFYEVFRSESGWFAIIGDVTGKGIGAATLTGLLRHGSRFASRHDPRPAGILRQLDEALRSRSEHPLCTALCVRLEDRAMTISSAGHPPALLARSDGTVREAPRAGPLLGAFANGAWPDESLSVADDELVLIYTDGVTESQGDECRFGLPRLKNLLSEQASSTPAEVLARLDAVLEEFRTGPRADDIAALAFRAGRD